MITTHDDGLRPIHIPSRTGKTQGTTITVADQRRQLAEQQRKQEEAERWRARRVRIAAEQAEQEQAEQEAAAAERTALDALPSSDEASAAEIDADPEVAALEERIASGDGTVSEAQLTKVRTAAAGRVRFARLRGAFADRKARLDAEQVEREHAAAAEAHAREVLAGHTDAALVPLYDEAVAAVSALVEATQGRNETLWRLVNLPTAQRVRGINRVNLTPAGAVVPLPEGAIAPVQTDLIVQRVLGRARIVGRKLSVVPAHLAADDTDPQVIARGRAQLAGQGGDA